MFRAMLEGPMAEDRGRLINIQVYLTPVILVLLPLVLPLSALLNLPQDVDPRAFEILISFMTGDAVRFLLLLLLLLLPLLVIFPQVPISTHRTSRHLRRQEVHGQED